MKTLALIGAYSVEETTHYARQIDSEIRHRFGDDHPAKLIALSLQTPDLATCLTQANWREAGRLLVLAAAQLAPLGAQSVLLCSSHLHVAAAGLASRPPHIPVFDPMLAAVRRAKHKRIGLIGTWFAKEEQLWCRHFARSHIHDVFLPVPRDRDHIRRLLKEEFGRGIVTETARADVIRIVYSLRQAGARAVVICAPELTSVLENTVPVLPLFDATELHALAAVEWMTAGFAAAGAPRPAQRET